MPDSTPVGADGLFRSYGSRFFLINPYGQVRLPRSRDLRKLPIAMLSSHAKRVFREELERFGRRTQRLSPHPGDQARRTFAGLELEEEIRALTDPGYRHESLLALASQTFPDRSRIYAVDGGSTRPQALSNGVTLCAFQAVMTGPPDAAIDDVPLDAFRSCSLATHAWGDLGGARCELSESDYVHLRRVHLSRDLIARGDDIVRVLQGLARVATEPYHAIRLFPNLEPAQSWLWLDGPIYPIGLYYDLAGEPLGEDDWTAWPGAMELLAYPLRLIETSVSGSVPLVGINKNPEGAWLMEFSLSEHERLWSSDTQFIKSVLDQTPNDALGYTNWFVQEGYSLPRRSPGSERESFELFGTLNEAIDLQLEVDDYHVCFFYVYDPRVDSVLKIEAPRAIVTTFGPDRMQAQSLSQIARGRGVPPAIRRADARARVTQRESQALMDLLRGIGLHPDWHYNQSRGEPVY